MPQMATIAMGKSVASLEDKKMKKLELDLRWVDKEGEETWADCPARAEIENALLDLVGKVVVVRITEKRTKERR